MVDYHADSWAKALSQKTFTQVCHCVAAAPRAKKLPPLPFQEQSVNSWYSTIYENLISSKTKYKNLPEVIWKLTRIVARFNSLWASGHLSFITQTKAVLGFATIRIATWAPIWKDNSSTEGDRASDITAVSHINVREKYSYTPGTE